MDGPELPPDGEHVWLWFLELRAACGSSGFGPAPIAWEAILAWTTLTGIIVRPSEVEAIRALDRVWMSDPKKGAGS